MRVKFVLACLPICLFCKAKAAEPNLPVHLIGADDLIAVAVYDAPELTRTVRAGTDGYITLPMLRQRILAQGRMTGELESAIAAALRSEQLLVDPVVTVTVAEYKSRPVSVTGAVRQPVTFQAEGPVTLLEALAHAGGLAPDAGPAILVTGAAGRSDLRRIPVKGLIDNAEPLLNLRLTGGEDILVPAAGNVFVLGNVRRPGAYPVRGDADATLLQILAVAEGLQPFSASNAYIYRRQGSTTARLEIAVPLGRIMARKADDIPLHPEDILYIPDAKTRRMTLASIEKILLFGSGAGTAAVYAGVR